MTNSLDKQARKEEAHDMNRDPISGAPGSHPVGTGVGATGGAVAGAAIGSVGGPVGAVVGGTIGAVVGGLAGKAGGEAVNPTVENEYWAKTYTTEPYYNSKYQYDDYAPAYRYGAQMRNDVRYRNSDWSDVEDALHTDWDARYGADGVATWDKVKAAVRHGWDRAML